MAAAPDETLPRWTTRLIGELHAADDRTRALTNPLDERQLNWKQRADTWSVGQCLEHLCLTNEVYLGPIAEALADARPSRVEDITPGMLGRWFIDTYIEPSATTKRARAPKKSTPVLSQVPLTIVDRFLRGNDNARKVIQRASGVDVNRIRFRNPFVPLIRLTVGTGFEILVRHERRHLLQAEKVRDAFLRDGPRFGV